MPAPTLITDLSTTAASNSPAGSETPSVLDDVQRAHAAFIAQLRDNKVSWGGTAGGTANAFTLTPSPASTSYVTGQAYQFIAVGTNTGAATVNVSALGAKAVQYEGAALTGSEILSGKMYSIRYDGTQFQLERTSMLRDKKGSDITAAATTDLGTATGNSVDVTHSSGTVATTSLGGASLPAGTEIETRYVISGGTLSLTHHATNLYLAGGANITLANGDVIRWRKMHSSNAEWKMVGGKLPASQAEAEAGTDNGRDMTPLRVAQAVAALGGGKVKQIVFANKTDTFSTASTSFTDLTGMSVSLTPTSASSKVALFAMVNVGGNAALFAFFKFLRDSTDILIGDTAGSRLRVNSVSTPAGAGQTMPATLLAIDSPGDTSSHTYKVQMAVGSGTGYINRTGTDTDSAIWPRAASMIIAMEYQP